ncbi:hypothetical protein [Sphingobacterium siyangense]|uniref:hypothetical protein n=1 Tax=Sphingobacterium siyangense TaxID=459529 RepID=UPI002FDC85F4
MRSFLLILIAIIVNFTHSYAQKNPELKNALAKMTAASTSYNAQAIVNLMSPRLIRPMGGRENALKLIKSSLAEIKKQNITVDSVINYTDRDIAKVKNIEYCFFPQLIVLGIPDSTKKMIRYATLLAIKEPSVKGWTFIDYTDLNDEKIKILLPELVGKLDFPRADIKPLVIPNEEVNSSIDFSLKVIDESMKMIKSDAAK